MGNTNEPMPYRTADTRDVIAAHRALRRMVCYLAAVTPAVADGDTAAAAALADLASELGDATRRLHAAQTDLLFPVLRAYLAALDRPGEAHEVVRIEEQGAGLQRFFVEAAVELDRFRMGASGVDRDVLADLFVALRARLLDHFGDVERVVLPLAAQYMTFAQWQQIGRQYLLGVPSQRRMFRTGAMLRECRRRDRSWVARSSEGPARFSNGQARRAFVREFGRIQDVLGAEPATLWPLRLTAAG